ncbi:MAG: AAA family ATPase [Spirochaetaceae bacterium]|jgi:AAA15 family ATPase/GTPase|nr:AAA family ATPase [Spirochaetaceae bacterium]
MFLNFKITNYRSIGKELVIDFTIRDSQKLGAFAEINDQSINNIACLVGPNASGKSNVLKGIVYFLRAMCMSYSASFFRFTIGLNSHFCCKSLPTEFSTEFIDNETQYKYEVSVLNGTVRKEILQKRDETTKRYSYIFKRETGKPIILSETIKINKQDSNRLGDDMSLLSLMLELNYFEKNEFLLLKRFYSNVQPGFAFIRDDHQYNLNLISQILQNDNIMLDELMEELKIIDTGISSLKLKEDKEKIKRADKNEITNEREFFTIQTSHKVANKDYPLIMLEESAGTLHYIETFISLSKVLQNGGLFIADELEQSLHPDLTSRIINRFMNKDKNPNNAQLLFTTHNPWFLQDLTKTQIFITEKNNEAETEITRLDEIAGVRNDENYFMKYIAGEYDGRPKIMET